MRKTGGREWGGGGWLVSYRVEWGPIPREATTLLWTWLLYIPFEGLKLNLVPEDMVGKISQFAGVWLTQSSRAERVKSRMLSMLTFMRGMVTVGGLALARKLWVSFLLMRLSTNSIRGKSPSHGRTKSALKASMRINTILLYGAGRSSSRKEFLGNCAS